MEMAGLEKIPITVGVVGHLDAITTPEHKLQIELLFKELKRDEELAKLTTYIV